MIRDTRRDSAILSGKPAGCKSGQKGRAEAFIDKLNYQPDRGPGKTVRLEVAILRSQVRQAETALETERAVSGIPVAAGLVRAVSAFSFPVWHDPSPSSKVFLSLTTYPSVEGRRLLHGGSREMRGFIGPGAGVTLAPKAKRAPGATRAQKFNRPARRGDDRGN